jgi:hypothetical protein
MLAPAGGTWRDTVTGLDEPMPTRTTRASDDLVLRRARPLAGRG